MLTSFAAAVENRFDRNFGGTVKGTADPYISGYSFIYFKYLPLPLGPTLQNDSIAALTLPEAQRLLSGSMLSLTPPGGTMNRTEFQGLGGTKWTAPTNFDYTNTLTIRFLEFSGAPILTIFNNWFRLIREYRTGTSGLVGPAYNKSTYASTILYWTTKPDGVTVEYSACYTGVYPTKDPQDLFAGDITASDKLEIDMEFSIDWAWKEAWVRAECSAMALLFKSEQSILRGVNGAITPNAIGTNMPIGGIVT